jgi:hypothetical protein
MLNPATRVALCTTRLECTGAGVRSFGTGYHYLFVAPGDDAIPTIITNKHVVNGATQIRVELQLMPVGGDNEVKEDGSVAGEVRYPMILEALDSLVVPHPDPAIDLCAILIGPVTNSLPAGLALKNYNLSRSMHISEDDAKYIRPVEPVLMIGYPNGLWDQVNNRPLARQGLTASHPLIKWMGSRQFVIDAACFPGSSGSPVFLYEDGMYRVGHDGYTPGTRARLLGTLWGGPTITAEGRLEPRAIPTSTNVPVVPLMMNLGYVIHASALDDLAEPILRHIGR